MTINEFLEKYVCTDCRDEATVELQGLIESEIIKDRDEIYG